MPIEFVGRYLIVQRPPEMSKQCEYEVPEAQTKLAAIQNSAN